MGPWRIVIISAMLPVVEPLVPHLRELGHEPVAWLMPRRKTSAAPRSPLRLEGALVGYWLRTRAETRPLAVHAAWRADPDTAVEAACTARTPEPLRRARRRAREARAQGIMFAKGERWQT